MDWRMSFLYLKGSDMMLEIADKNDINRLEDEICMLRNDVQTLKEEVHKLMNTNNALSNFISTIQGGIYNG